MKSFFLPRRFWRFLAGLLLCLPLLATAQEDDIRKSLGERVPALSEIDEIRETPMPGLFELTVGHEVLYTDAQGNFLIQGTLLDTQTRQNLTEERLDKLTAIGFKDLQLDHAMTLVKGDGQRQLAVFEDPNCPYCKRFEQNLRDVDNLTVHFFLLPILGPDSVDKSEQIWCHKDPLQAWEDWMLKDKKPKGQTDGCDTTALDENIAFARAHRINGTPTLIFEDGHRVPGAISTEQIEELLNR